MISRVDGLMISLVLASTLLSFPCPGQQADSNLSAISSLLEKHDNALKQHDLKMVTELFAPGPKTVLLGTGPGERWEGKEEIKSAYEHFIQDFDKGSLSHTCYWKSGGSMADAAWLSAMCKMTDSLKGKTREYELNISAVLEKVQGKWLFRQLHFSNLTGSGSK